MSKQRRQTGSAKVYRSLQYRKSGSVKCPTGKIRYPSAIDAGIALGKAQASRRTRGRDEVVEVRQYLCDLCRGWHLTSKPQRQERAA